MDAGTLTVRGGAAMAALGAHLLPVLPRGAVVWLHGDLGAGKTTLVRGLIHAMDPDRKVKSPTFTVVEPYDDLPEPVCHFDLYRLADPEELELLGVRDYFDGRSLVFVEWPEKAGDALPPPDLEVYITLQEQGAAREVRFVTADVVLAARLVGVGGQVSNPPSEP